MSLTPPQPLAREVPPLPDEELAEIRQADADWPEEGRRRVVFARHRHLLLLEVDRLRLELVGSEKARVLLMAGMEASESQRMELKLRVRELEGILSREKTATE